MLQEADMGVTSMAMGGSNARFAADNTLLVRFYLHPRLNQTRTKAEGRPIYEEVPFVQIMQPGNKDSIIVRPATEMDKNRFAEHWMKYQARDTEEHVEGTLLTEWPGVTRSQAEELAFFNVKTLEQLVGMSDSNAQGIMGVNILKQRAQAYLENADANAATQQLKEQQEENERLRNSISEMAARMEILEDIASPEEKPKSSGRKKTA